MELYDMNRRISVYAGALLHLSRSYATTAPRTFYRLTMGLFTNPKRTQQLIHHILEGVDADQDDPVLRTADIVDLLPSGAGQTGFEDVGLPGPYYRKENADTRLLMELTSLAYLVRSIRARTIFEMGTFVGRMTRLLALNAGPEARVFTLDLPRSDVLHDVGRDYRNTPEASRITQLHGDSATFDFGPWHGQCDFVWVDACHDYRYVKMDTESALKLVRPGGWIGWHDYRHSSPWSGVTRGVRDFRATYPDITCLRGTSTALLHVPS